MNRNRTLFPLLLVVAALAGALFLLYVLRDADEETVPLPPAWTGETGGRERRDGTELLPFPEEGESPKTPRLPAPTPVEGSEERTSPPPGREPGPPPAGASEDPPLTGRVVRPDGTPVAGARLRLASEHVLPAPLLLHKRMLCRYLFGAEEFQNPDEVLAETVSDEAGAFTLPVEEATTGAWALHASAKGFATRVVHALPRPPASREPLEVVMKPANVLAGRVLSPGKGPVVLSSVQAFRLPHEARRTRDAKFYVEWFRRTTGPEGRFRFDDLPVGPYVLGAKKEGFVDGVRPEVRVPSRGEITLTLTKGYVLEGVVYERDAGVTVPGVLVFVQPTDGRGRPIRGKTDDNGAYRLEGIPPGSAHLSVFEPGAPEGLIKVSGREGEVVHRDVVLAPCLIIAGRVVHGEGKTPVEGALVQRKLGARLPDMVKSGPDGSFLVRVEPYEEAGEAWTFHLTACKEGWGLPAPVKVQIPTTVRRADGVEIPLWPLPLASVTVVDAAGKPVTGALVHRVAGTSCARLGVTDAGGACEIRTLFGDNLVLATDEAHAVGYALLEGVAPGAERRDIRFSLSRGGIVFGRVVDDTGDPVAGRELVLAFREPSLGDFWSLMMPVHRKIRTDGEGAFRAERLCPGPWKAIFASEGHVQDDPVSFEVEEGKEVRIEVDVHAPLSIEGQVVDGNGTPVAFAWMRARPRDGGRTSATRTRENGRFAFQGLASGTFTIYAFLEGYRPERIEGVEAGAVNLRIVLRRR